MLDSVVSLLGETFEAIVFDWDDMALSERQRDLSHVRERIEDLCGAGVHVVVVTGSRVDDIDQQLWARPHGRGRLHLCCAQGSEVYALTTDGPRPVFRTERADASQWAADWLSHQGITGELVLVCEGSLRYDGAPDGCVQAQSVFARAVAVSLRGKPDAMDHGFAHPESALARLNALLDEQLGRRATFPRRAGRDARRSRGLVVRRVGELEHGVVADQQTGWHGRRLGQHAGTQFGVGHPARDLGGRQVA